MHLSDKINMALSSLYHRKLRTLLTVLGVTVGTTLVVTVVSLGLAMNASTEAMLQEMGDLTKITVYANNYSGEENAALLDDAAITQIAKIPGVELATPIYRPRNFQAAVYTGKKDRYKMEMWELIGMYPEAMEKMGYTLLEGEFPQSQTDSKKPLSVLVGEYASFAFFDNKNPDRPKYVWPEMDENGELRQKPFVDIMKEELMLRTNKVDEKASDDTVYTRELKVVGRLKEDYNKGWETSQGIIMTLEDVKRLEEAYKKINKIKPDPTQKPTGYDNAVIYVSTIDDVDSVDVAIRDLGFETQSLESIRQQMQGTVQQQQLFLGMLGSVSLVVAAIGITNTMYMSIYERTREIGVMKVLGCQVVNIREMFLMEAGFIGFLGGALGAFLSWLFSFVLNRLGLNIGMILGGIGGGMENGMGTPSSLMPWWLLAGAILFATSIGLAAGFPPSSRATKISALEAIRQA